MVNYSGTRNKGVGLNLKDNRMAVILAAGKGTRMKSKLYKVLHPVCGLPMVEHVRRAVEAANVEKMVAIVGHGADEVKQVLGKEVSYALQEEQLGTGHAVLQAKSQLEKLPGQTLVICGDTPLFTGNTLNQLFDYHQAQGAKATILTAYADNPFGYGRVIRDEDGNVIKNVEQKDGTPEELLVKEINTGTYVFDNELLFEMLSKVRNDNAQGEYYLPDVIELIRLAGGKVSAYQMKDLNEGLGINDRVALAKANRIMQERILTQHMVNGVSFTNPATNVIEADVTIGPDTLIESGVVLKGKTQIGADSFIGANSEIVESRIADQVQITQSVIEYSEIESGSSIGPFAHIRPNSVIGQDVHIGNFVEVKNASLGQGTKAGHLTYIGDADLGKDINVGCGTIFVNYDGKQKHRSTVDDQVFIGCNANIISPVNIEKKVFIAAGTTVTRDVEEESLAISRVKQENIPNYWEKFQNK